MTKIDDNKSNRREFLAAASATAVLAQGRIKSAPAPEKAGLPSIKLGDHSVSRLLAGFNPIGGYSYLGPNMNEHMKEYFTVENTTDFLLR